MITILLLKTFELLHLSKASWCVRQSAIFVLSWNWPRSCWNTNSLWQEPCKLTLDSYLWNFTKERLRAWQILYIYPGRHREGNCLFYNLASFRDAQWLLETGYFQTQILIVRRRLVLKRCFGGLFQRLEACPVKRLWSLAMLRIVLIVQTSILHPISVKETELFHACMAGDRLTVFQLAKVLCEREIVICRKLKLYVIYR